MCAASGARRRRYQPDPAVVDDAVRAIVHGYNPSRVVVFGSFARGDTHECSDLDLIIIKDSGERFLDRIGAVRDLCLDLPVGVQPLVYTPDELRDLLEQGSGFIEAALAEGIVAYDALPRP